MTSWFLNCINWLKFRSPSIITKTRQNSLFSISMTTVQFTSKWLESFLDQKISICSLTSSKVQTGGTNEFVQRSIENVSSGFWSSTWNVRSWMKRFFREWMFKIDFTVEYFCLYMLLHSFSCHDQLIFPSKKIVCFFFLTQLFCTDSFRFCTIIL